MSKNKLVYSTNPNQNLEEDEFEEDLNIDSSGQRLRIRLETKHRAGKKATIINGFKGSDSELEVLAKQLKTKLGVGGTVKDGEIIIQGDYIVKSKDLLIQLGYKNTK
jgi:translation initiation factor 1